MKQQRRRRPAAAGGGGDADDSRPVAVCMAALPPAVKAAGDELLPALQSGLASIIRKSGIRQFDRLDRSLCQAVWNLLQRASQQLSSPPNALPTFGGIASAAAAAASVHFLLRPPGSAGRKRTQHGEAVRDFTCSNATMALTPPGSSGPAARCCLVRETCRIELCGEQAELLAFRCGLRCSPDQLQQEMAAAAAETTGPGSAAAAAGGTTAATDGPLVALLPTPADGAAAPAPAAPADGPCLWLDPGARWQEKGFKNDKVVWVCTRLSWVVITPLSPEQLAARQKAANGKANAARGRHSAASPHADDLAADAVAHSDAAAAAAEEEYGHAATWEAHGSAAFSMRPPAGPPASSAADTPAPQQLLLGSSHGLPAPGCLQQQQLPVAQQLGSRLDSWASSSSSMLPDTPWPVPHHQQGAGGLLMQATSAGLLPTQPGPAAAAEAAVAVPAWRDDGLGQINGLCSAGWQEQEQPGLFELPSMDALLKDLAVGGDSSTGDLPAAAAHRDAAAAAAAAAAKHSIATTWAAHSSTAVFAPQPAGPTASSASHELAVPERLLLCSSHGLPAPGCLQQQQLPVAQQLGSRLDSWASSSSMLLGVSWPGPHHQQGAGGLPVRATAAGFLPAERPGPGMAAPALTDDGLGQHSHWLADAAATEHGAAQDSTAHDSSWPGDGLAGHQMRRAC